MPPRHTHRRSLPLVQNPAWADPVLVAAYENLIETHAVPAAWAPKFTDLQAEGARVAGQFREFGCGTYGCVYPTLDDNVVLKITTDSTEFEFATRLSAMLVAPVCVHYLRAFTTNSRHKNSQICMLWRESAFNVGKLADAVSERGGDGHAALELVQNQWRLAQVALKAIWRDADDVAGPLADWALSLEEMADQTGVPELQAVGAGMLSVYRQQDVFFGDVHVGNLGQVSRDEGTVWVITDPGNIVVLGDD